MDDTEVRAIRADYDAAQAAADTHRTERLRAARAAGRTVRDLEDLTGWSRETIRRALLSAEAREDIRARRRKTTE